jgi:lipid A 3-O-deacylase
LKRLTHRQHPFARSFIGLGVLLLFFLGRAGPVLAGENQFDGYSITLGVADRNHGSEPVEDTYIARIGARRRWFSADRRGLWNWRGYWTFQAGYWRWADKREPPKGSDRLWEIAATPVFRLERTSAFTSGARPFVEAGIGAHLISETWVSSRDMSTNFHFGSHVGAGWYFGRGDRFELALQIQHLSNAGLKEPNPGINFGLLQFAYHP